MSDTETRVYIADTEAELRTVSASQFLAARKRGLDYAKENGGDMLSASVVFWAELIRAAAYDGDTPLFSTADEVLTRLTVDEIVSVSEDIGLPKTVTPMTSETETKKAVSPEAEIIPIPKTEAFSDSETANKENESPDEETAAERTVRKKPDGTDYSDGREEYTKLPQRITQTPTFSGMQEISDFFERDARRYDGSLR